MIGLTVHEILTATDGRLALAADADEAAAQQLVVDGPVVTDTRQAGPGGLYVARVGEQADGHDYVPQARQAGAVAALVQRRVEDPLPQIVVPDTEVAFGLLARDVTERAGGDLLVVGVTGSSGKTSTKDLLAHLLSGHGPTVAAQESFNSEIGVPLTVCRITPDTRYLVVEMGARGLGHIAYLATMAPPDIGVVLNVGHAHASEFGSMEVVQQAKSELVRALVAGDVAVLNAADPRVAAMADLAAADYVDVLWTGTGDGTRAPGRHVWAQDITLDPAGRPSFDLVADLTGLPGRPAGPCGQAPVGMQLVGAHQAANAVAAAAVALLAGMDLSEVATRLSSATPANRWRMEVAQRADGVTVVNDAYNANPDSMAAALRALAAMTPGEGGTRWAVLGTMLELGEQSDALHAGQGALAVGLGIDHVLVVGEGARPIADAVTARQNAGTEALWVPDADTAEQVLAQRLQSGDIALFKSSRDSGLRWLGERVLG